MRLLGHIVLACLLLAALRWLAAVMAVAILIGILAALIRAPIQTLSVAFAIMMLMAFASHPALGLCVTLLSLGAARLAGP